MPKLSDEEKLELEEAVARGVAWLDENVPNWQKQLRESIAEDQNDVAMLLKPYFGVLDMRNCFACVLGRLFGDYFTAISEHFADIGSENYGFAVGLRDGHIRINETACYEYLNVLWRRYL